jgi:outer membrane protein insertion porin family
MKILWIFLIAMLLACTVTAFAQNPQRIADISVVGNERIDKAFITNNIKTKEGEAYDLDKLREDIRSIYRTGFFSDVQIDVKDTDKGKAVTFVVIERSPIKAIYVSGNKKVRTEDIRDKLKVKTNTVLNIERIKESMDEIKKLYASKAYYAIRVNYSVDYEDGGTDVNVRFVVEEPEMAYVRKIILKGNKVFKESKLKDYIRTREKGIFSWFTGSGILDEEKLEEDRQNLEAFYADNGYVRVKVGTPDVQVSKDGKSITITLSIEEGNVYQIADIGYSGDTIFTASEFFNSLQSKKGATFRTSLLHQDVLTITDLYQDKGFAFCEVVPLTTINDETRKVNISFDIVKGKEIYINRINITGNTKTRDKVVRRELALAEGDRFSATDLKRTKKKLRNTTYFKEVDLKLSKVADPDKVNLDITVEEKPTGTLSLGIGYSSVDQMVLTGSVSQENLFGTGRKVFLTAGFGLYTQEFQFSYLEPYVFDKNLSAAFSIVNYSRIMDTYNYKRTGGSVTLSRPLTEDIRVGTTYRIETVNVSQIDVSASTYIRQQEGTATTSSVTLSLTKNSIDDVLNPTKGVNSNISAELAGGPFSGDNDFYRFIAYYGRYFPAFWDSAFFVKGTAGAIRSYSGKDVPIYEKFYVGSLYTVRGFKYGEAGPIDETGQVIGSNNELFFNLEWIFPIYKPAGVKGVVFYDLGHGFDDNKGFLFNGIRQSAGFGIRWFSPLGPIRLELGFNLAPKEGERGSVFDFAIGTQY